MSLTAHQNYDKTSRAWSLYPDKTLLVSILYLKNTDKAWLVFLVCYCFPLAVWTFVWTPKRHAFCGIFWSRSKNSQQVFFGTNTLCYASCFYTAIKHCCSFFKHYIKHHSFSYAEVLKLKTEVDYYFVKWQVAMATAFLIKLVLGCRLPWQGYKPFPSMVLQIDHSLKFYSN